jgi:hypothetical protein
MSLNGVIYQGVDVVWNVDGIEKIGSYNKVRHHNIVRFETNNGAGCGFLNSDSAASVILLKGVGHLSISVALLIEIL